MPEFSDFWSSLNLQGVAYVVADFRSAKTTELTSSRPHRALSQVSRTFYILRLGNFL